MLKQRFEKAFSQATAQTPEKELIGTQNESLLHMTLKYFFEPNFCFHEQKLGKFFADIYRDGHITEIQTSKFFVMNGKLDFFLNEKDFSVEIVYPIAKRRFISWMDPITGEISDKKRGRRDNIYDVFTEIYGIRDFIASEKLSILIALVDIEEQKALNPRRKNPKSGARRVSRIPLGIDDIIYLETSEDYLQFIPEKLQGQFTSKDFAVCAKIGRSLAQTTLNILTTLGIVMRIDRTKDGYVYQVCSRVCGDSVPSPLQSFEKD